MAITYLPVVKDRQSEGLALSVRAKVGLKAEGVNSRDEGLDGVEGGTRDGRVLRDVTSAKRGRQCESWIRRVLSARDRDRPPPGEHRVDGGDAISGRLDLHEVVRLHQPWGGLKRTTKINK